jgi:hypothetical protein
VLGKKVRIWRTTNLRIYLPISEPHVAAQPTISRQFSSPTIRKMRILKINFIPVSTRNPVESLINLMKANRMRPIDLAALLGVSKSLVSDILYYRRGISRPVIRKLASRFKVPQEVFNQPYQLVPRSTAKKSSSATKPAPTPADAPAPARRSQKLAERDAEILNCLQRRSGKPTIAKLKNGRSLTIWNIIPGYFGGDAHAHLTTNCRPKIPDAEVELLLTTQIDELIDPETMTHPG